MEHKGDYLIGIPELDAQHAQLFECIERLERAVDQRQMELAVYYVIGELKDYARVHFTVEEVVMRLFDYPGLAAHAAEHREFEESLRALEKMELLHDMHAEAGRLLREWLDNHVRISDKRYADYILAQRESARG